MNLTYALPPFLGSSVHLHMTRVRVDVPSYTQESWGAPRRRTSASEVGKLRLQQARRLALMQSVAANERQGSQSQDPRQSLLLAPNDQLSWHTEHFCLQVSEATIDLCLAHPLTNSSL